MKEATGIDTCTLASKMDFLSLKTKLDKLDVDKIKTVPADLSKLSNVVDNDAIKKAVYDKLVIKVNAINTKIPSTSGLLTTTQYDLEKQGLEKKIEDVDNNS